MRKYIISVVVPPRKNDITQGGAAVKAPKDIESIVVQKGYERIEILMCGYRGIQYVYAFLQLLYYSFRIKSNSCILFQYPMLSPKLLILALPFYKRFNLQVLIHDLNSLRVSGRLSGLEINVLRFFDNLIVHSTAMREVIAQYLPAKEYSVLGYFPYCAEPEIKRRQFGNEVCFAGNLYKSSSLIEYFENISQIILLLYIKRRDYVVFNSRTLYKGLFDPDFIQGIEGNWGLIWDGNDVEEQFDFLKQYTRINAPHKFSLYVMAHMPVIVWEESAIAQVVKECEIGFTIGSLQEIENKIMQVTPEQYGKYVDNIIRFSKEVGSGKNVLEAIR